VCACLDLRYQASEGFPWQGAMVSYAVIVNLQVCVILFKLLANAFIVYDCWSLGHQACFFRWGILLRKELWEGGEPSERKRKGDSTTCDLLSVLEKIGRRRHKKWRWLSR
jgi:hypothetical protein